jgi:hypothetical protein
MLDNVHTIIGSFKLILLAIPGKSGGIRATNYRLFDIDQMAMGQIAGSVTGNQ